MHVFILIRLVKYLLKVILYMKEDCPLCEEAIILLSLFKHEYPLEVEARDIHTNDTWLENYQLSIPVIDINGKQIDGAQINYEALEQLLKDS